MKPLPFLLLALTLLASACVSTPAPSARDRLHAFVQAARAEHGRNQRDWPPEVRQEFQHLFQEVYGE